MSHNRTSFFPLMKTRQIMSYGDSFFNIVRRSQIVGSATLPLQNVSTGTRQSAESDGAVRLANTVDSVPRGGIPMAFSMAGATNLVSTVVTAAGGWTIGASATSSDNGDFTYRAIMPVGGGTWIAYVQGAPYVGAHTFVVEIKSRTTNYNINIAVADNTGGSSPVYNEDLAITTTDWTRFVVPFTPTALTTTILIRDDGVTAADIDIRNARCVALSAPAAAFADGTGAAEVYGTDLVSCSPTWTAQGTIVQAVVPYGYSGAGNPAGSNGRLFQTADFWELYRTGNLLSTGNLGTGPIASGVAVANGSPTIVSVDWNGVKYALRVNNTFSRTEAVMTDAPNGAFYIGNSVSPTVPFHGGLATLIFPWVLTDAEYEIVRVGLNNLFSTVEFN